MELKKRRGFIPLSSYKPKVVNGIKVCLKCDKRLPKRRRKYCSDHCMLAFMDDNYHSRLRIELINQVENRCQNCHDYSNDTDLILDHIIPIALGGEEFNKDNLQILCKECNKLKTREDLKEIAIVRRESKKQSKLNFA